MGSNSTEIERGIASKLAPGNLIIIIGGRRAASSRESAGVSTPRTSRARSSGEMETLLRFGDRSETRFEKSECVGREEGDGFGNSKKKIGS